MGRAQEQVARTAEAVLEPGEIVEIATWAPFGRVSVKRQVLTAAAVSIATAGLFTAYVTPKRMPIVLTTKRFLLLGSKEGVLSDQADGKIVAQMPRSELRARPPKRGIFNIKLYLTDPQGTPVSRMIFGHWAMGDASRFAAALGQPATTATK
jgi:hypothetical protein